MTLGDHSQRPLSLTCHTNSDIKCSDLLISVKCSNCNLSVKFFKIVKVYMYSCRVQSSVDLVLSICISFGYI